MKMRTFWIKYIIWLSALCVTSTLSAVIQKTNTQNSTTQIASLAASSVEKNIDRLQLVEKRSEDQKVAAAEVSDTSFRNEKAQSNSTAIGESIKMVASQLLRSNKTPPPPSTTGEQTAVTDTRTPPFMKNQTKTKVTNKPTVKIDEAKRIENSHAGVAIPVSTDELEKEVKNKLQNSTRKPPTKESSTTSEGLSTWVLVNGKPTPTTLKPEVTKNKNDKSENTQSSKENKKSSQNKSKPATKPTRTTATPQIKPIFVRKPVAISSNKSDLIASGSAVDENEMNKIKASALANVQKNSALGKTTSSESVISTTTDNAMEEKVKDSSKEIMIKINQVNLKDKKKSEAKEKHVAKETEVSIIDDKSESDSIESKQAEIELPVSTPSSTTKVKSKKNKNRRRKPSTASKLETKVDDNKDKDTKENKKVKINKTEENSGDIYSFISRKVIPSVGIGLVSLAGLFGIASYFFNPFAAVRRSDTLIERKDLYHYNDEQYADDGGQREEDVLGSLFSDGSNDNKVQNPNIRHNQQNPNRYAVNPVNPTQFTYPKQKTVPSSTEQNVRYRKVGYGSDTSNFVSNDRIGPKSPDVIQGSAYSENIHYNTHSNDNREPYAVYPQPQPVYKSPDRQVDNSEYSADVYHAISPYQLSDSAYSQPLQYNPEMFDSTNTPMSNIHLNDEDVVEHQQETGYTVDGLTMDSDQNPQFVVGNVPKELIQATPVTVPEHGPRSLRIRRSVEKMEAEPKVESAAESLKIILKSAPKHDDDDSMSNEIDADIMKFEKHNEPSTNTYLDSYRNETFEKLEIDESSTLTENLTTTQSITEHVAPSSSPTSEHKDVTDIPSSSNSADYPSTSQVHQYPFLDFVRSLLDFKLRLGISILKATSDNLARYLKDVENQFNATAPQTRSRFR